MALASLCAARLWIEPDRAVTTCEEAVAAGAGLVGDRFLAIALLNRGERGRLRAHLRSISRGEPPNTFGPFMSVLLDSQEGRWPEVLARIEAAGDPDDSWFHAGVTEAIFGLGDPARIRRAVLRTVELDRALASSLSAHHAYLGDLASAAEFAPYLQASSPRADTYRALTRWRQGDLDGAIEDLRAIAAKAPLSADPANPHPIYLLGEALVEAGHDAEAIDVLRRFQAMPLTYPTWLHPRSLYHLARAQERSGDRQGARETAGALLRLWEKASPDQPLLAEARAMGARLGVR
jgi:tetratricopeptide (TPR) repeat protein